MLESALFRGERLRLAPLTRSDMGVIAQWYQDGGFLRLFDAEIARPKTEEELWSEFEEVRKRNTQLNFGVHRLADDALLGVVAIEEIAWNHGTAWLSIGLGPEYWDQGFGTEAMQLLLRYAFMELNLYRVQLTVFAYNERAQAVYRKVGFQHEGTLREFLLRDGRRYDMFVMGLLAREWWAIHGQTPEDPKL